ncbi:protein transport protein SFT2-like [Pecten maximus]|uniref:protein transport protein SFT2-like n=1 Tax=Pecten maximus TaxID=6579 RepID=UPI0014584AC8|nr:protein transport protein SFT2-like [Pecten maximus]
MAGLNKDLQDYLSRGSVNGSSETDDRGASGGFSFGKLNVFRKSEEEVPLNNDDVANSWFSQAQRDPYLPSLTKKQRILGFVICLLLGTFCFSLASLYIPLLLLKARKFAVLYSLGSVFVIASFSLLWGPMNHIKHLCSVERMPFTVAYFGTMFATLYFSLWVRSTIFTVLCAVGQILALVWYIVSYIPGGQTGMKFFSKIFYATASKTVQKTLPI